MDTVLNMKAFLATAQAGSFSAAARVLGVAPSIATKRVTQLEQQIRGRLFSRSTRQVKLTPLGERYLPVVQALVSDFDKTLSIMSDARPRVEGHVRVKCPTTMGYAFLSDLLVRFQKQNPMISMDIMLYDRPVNPIEEGFDIAIGGATASFGNVIDVPFCPLGNRVYASPSYIREAGRPKHPRELADHACLNFFPNGPIWTFATGAGHMSIETSPIISSNDLNVLLQAACNGNGIAFLPQYLAADALKAGRLEVLLDQFSVPDVWIKALVPAGRIHQPAVQALLSFLRQELSTFADEAGDGGDIRPQTGTRRMRRAARMLR
jgi:DNA-binding transcriptional LysR family regulator